MVWQWRDILVRQLLKQGLDWDWTGNGLKLFMFLWCLHSFIGASLSEPHQVRSTVKSVFLLVLLVCLYACHRLIWLSTTKSTSRAI